MAAWPGGACPHCGEFTPPMMVRCHACRGLLNDELKTTQIESPAFEPLQEIATEVFPTAFHVKCPSCETKLRVEPQKRGRHIRCLHCEAAFRFDIDDENKPYAVRTVCPHCFGEMRTDFDRVGSTICCEKCEAQLCVVLT